MSNSVPITTLAPLAIDERNIASSPTEEYIAGTERQGFYVGNIALPQTIDEAEGMFGRGIYDQMGHDATLGPTTRLVAIRALKGGLSVTPSHDAPPEDQPDAEATRKYEQAVECADFCRYNLGRLRKVGEDVMSVLRSMVIEAMRGGHKIAEINTEIAADGPFAGDRVLSSLRPKPRGNYAFVIRSLGGLVGVMAVIPGRSNAIRQGILYDPATIPNLVSPDKLLVIRIGGSNGDPRGDSCYRMAYDAWLRYQRLKKQSMDVSHRFGDGYVIAEIDKDSEVEPKDITKNLKNLRGGGYYCPPRGVKVNIHYPTVSPDWFDFQFRQCKEEMAQAIIINAREILSAEHGSEKDAGSAQDVVNEVSDDIGNIVETSVENQLFYSLCFWKWGKEIADEFAPKAVLGGTVSPDFAANASGLASLGYSFDESQIPGVERTFKISPRRADWQKVRDERAQAATEATQTSAQSQETTFRRAGQPRQAA